MTAHEWNKPHNDEYLSVTEAEALGFAFQIESVREQDRSAVRISIGYPTIITGEELRAGDINEGCGILDSDLDVDVLEGDRPGYSQYKITLVTTTECAQSSTFWARYGPASFYYINTGERRQNEGVLTQAQAIGALNNY